MSRLACTLAILVAFAASPVFAGFEEEFADRLDAADLAGAAARAEAELAARPDSGQARFALGAAQFLLAVEGLGQGLYSYGLRNEYGLDTAGMVLGNTPFLRLPIPANPAPEPATYAALRALLASFTDDLGTAADTLAGVGPDAFQLTLDIARIGFDFDGDGRFGEREGLLEAFRATAGPAASDAGFATDFDQSDAPWLQGYCHLLSALAAIPLAYDWETTFDLTFHELFPSAATPSAAMRAETDRLMAALDALRDAAGALPSYPQPPDGMSRDDFRKTPAFRRFRERNRLETALQYGGVADLVAFVHLFHWELVAPARMAAARRHLLEMIALSRANWRRIGAETDDAREWVPGPHQTGVLEGLRVDDDTVAAWHVFLDEFERLLTGDSLIAHWRFAGRGVNLARMFEEPAALDPVLIAQGSAVLPYLEEGDLIDADRAEEILDLFGGGFFAYFLFFN